MSSNSNITISNVDPAIDYNGPWILNMTTDVQQPTQSTSVNGSSISLNFNGTQINVLGVIPAGQGPLIANYTIDNGEPRSRSEPILSQNTSLNFQTLFSSENLDMGEHTIVINVLGTGIDRNYTFQQFQMTTAVNNTGKSMNVGGSGSGSGNKGGDKNGDDNSNNHDSKGNSIQDLNTVAIVGGILGSVSFLILVFFGAFFVWRKKRYQKKRDCEKEDSQSEASATHQDRLIHPQGALNVDNRSVSGDNLLDVQFATVAEAPVITPFILPTQENARINQNAKDQRRVSYLTSSSTTRLPTSLPPYSFVSAQSRPEARVSGGPSSAGASYAASSEAFQSRNRPSEDNPFKD